MRRLQAAPLVGPFHLRASVSLGENEALSLKGVARSALLLLGEELGKHKVLEVAEALLR